MTARVEQLGPPITAHGEGPVWDDELQRLLLVDIPAGDVLTWDSTTAGVVDRLHVGASVGAVRPRTGDCIRMNDGACDPSGAFWCGSMALDESPGKGQLWRLDAGGEATLALRDVTISNGIAFSNDGARAFYVDSPTRRVDVLHLDGGAVVGREEWARVEVGGGVPDGICRDAEGGLWVAVHGGGAVVRFDERGGLDDVVTLPVRRPTACAFGGPDLDVLHVTTSALDSGADASAGALFAIQPRTRGLPTHRYAG